MKTKKIPNKSYRYDILLTVSGWGLAIFVSLLYLNDSSGPPIVIQETPKPIESPVVVRSDRVETLLYESRILLARNRPAEAINRITTLWSVCHTTHQDVPDESHRVFAQAVSAMSRSNSVVQRPSTAPKAQEQYEMFEPLKKQERHRDGSTKKKSRVETENKSKPALTIPSPAYPLAKFDSPYPKAKTNTSEASLPSPPPRYREPGKRPSAKPQSPPTHTGHGRFPSPPPPFPGGSDGVRNRFPPPPHHRQSARAERRDPLEAGSGGPPPGYLNY